MKRLGFTKAIIFAIALSLISIGISVFNLANAQESPIVGIANFEIQEDGSIGNPSEFMYETGTFQVTDNGMIVINIDDRTWMYKIDRIRTFDKKIYGTMTNVSDKNSLDFQMTYDGIDTLYVYVIKGKKVMGIAVSHKKETGNNTNQI